MPSKMNPPLFTLADPLKITQLPWVQAIRPINPPYLKCLPKSSLEVWHVDIELKEWVIPEKLQTRWAQDKTANNNETWRKRPLVVGADSNCEYSCGEVEIAARLRQAGYEAQWVSEWSSYKHVDCWERFCVKRRELNEQQPALWEFDQWLRKKALETGADLGKSGGHPDVAAWQEGSKDFVYLEYKGPGDRIGPKQEQWVRSILDQIPERLPFLIVNGIVSS